MKKNYEVFLFDVENEQNFDEELFPIDVIKYEGNLENETDVETYIRNNFEVETEIITVIENVLNTFDFKVDYEVFFGGTDESKCLFAVIEDVTE